MKTPGTLLVIGGTSGIGRAVALAYAKAGWTIQLAARNEEEAHRNAEDLRIRAGGEVVVAQLDILDAGSFAAFFDQLPRLPDTIVCVVGTLGDQTRAQVDSAHAAMVLRSNFEGPALLLACAAERFLARGSGTIVGVSSVAGDRGRASNYYYGAAKAGFTAFLSGLRNRLATSRVRVVTIKPGFVHTAMTAGLRLPPLLTAEPEQVARRIFAAAEGQRGEVVYIPRQWRVIMAIIRALPEPIFKHLRL